ncbi:hypothetical protein DKG71_35290 [Streptomyces sp. NEAU-S7GS2]|nr:hypothetical protein DKG71_35290 [Streptomyces sp. NEAU-S7GS2]
MAPGGKKTVVQPTDPATGEQLPADVRTWGTSASGRYVVFGARQRQDSDVQYVVDLEAAGGAKVIRANKGRGGLAVWGTKLWRTGETTGTLTSLGLKSGATETVQTGDDCLAVDVQAVGRWVPWDCKLNISGGHGVYDRVSKELGDGFILTHDTDNQWLLVVPIETRPGPSPRRRNGRRASTSTRTASASASPSSRTTGRTSRSSIPGCRPPR